VNTGFNITQRNVQRVVGKTRFTCSLIILLYIDAIGFYSSPIYSIILYDFQLLFSTYRVQYIFIRVYCARTSGLYKRTTPKYSNKHKSNRSLAVVLFLIKIIRTVVWYVLLIISSDIGIQIKSFPIVDVHKVILENIWGNVMDTPWR